jgi:hypothetical protein
LESQKVFARFTDVSTATATPITNVTNIMVNSTIAATITLVNDDEDNLFVDLLTHNHLSQSLDDD